MMSLFEEWSNRIPKYDSIYRESLFKEITQYGGGSDQGRASKGKDFENGYELYIYAFFLGLNNSESRPIPKKNKKVDFRMKINAWGHKENRLLRKDFSELQKYIFMACVAKTNVDLIALDKGEIEVSKTALQLIETMESYTNGGLEIISLKLEDQRLLFDQPTGFFNLIYKKEP
jgi:hypothetical protein